MKIKSGCEQFENFLFTIFPTLKSNKIKHFGEKSQTGCFSQSGRENIVPLKYTDTNWTQLFY